ncbi:MAG: LPS export ABC transporter periplasmic protein LptC [Bacteroidaceae bacterium]|nr:LPS export ABC transporter periplasmic protein LptC [Bacteroidaceae bacterium]MBR1799939.1 LPS export ABC transporter periplasmic protein LptC [Bacteroidaceae bacterium]
MKKSLFIIIAFFTLFACNRHHEHIAPAVHDQDSLPFLTAHGISNLISDSGIISYKIVAEDWNIYTTEPQKWTFLKGLFLEKFDTTFHVEWHVQSDTAYCHNNRTWELRGRVVILNRDGDLFETEELFWDMDEHQMWNTMFMTITKPGSQQQLQGYNFRSNEEMTDYHIDNSAGYTPAKDDTGNATDEPKEERASQADSRRARQGQ